MKTAFLLFFLILLYSVSAEAQQSINSLSVKDLNVNGNIQVVSTTEASTPCPEMTETQRDAIASPILGNCVTNSDTLALNVYNGTIWKAAGGGGVNQWITSTGYNVDDVVIESFKFYVCLIAHTSGTFATDLAGLNWQEVSPFTDTDTIGVNLKAQNGSSVTVQEIQVTGNLSTNTATDKYLIETGNKNLLSNPSFEHVTTASGWSSSVTSTATATYGTAATATLELGLKQGTFSCAGGASGGTCLFYQDATTSKVLQGLVMAFVSTTNAAATQVYSRVNGANNKSITLQQTSEMLYKVPEIIGSTSTGIGVLVTVPASTTYTGTIDDAFVGAVDLKQDVSVCNSTECEVDFSAKIDTSDAVSDENLDWITGSCTDATLGEATCVFKTGLFTVTPNCLLTIDFATGQRGGQIVASSASSITVKGFSTGSTDVSMNHILSCSKQGADFTAAKRLSGASVYTTQCGANCVDTFTAKVTSAGVPTEGEGVSFINGNCAITDTSLFTCTWDTSIFTVAPSCTVSMAADVSGASQSAVSGTVNTTSGGFRTLSGGAKSAQPFNISCQKTGADFVATRTIQGTFNEVDVTPGVTKPKTCHYAFGGASATLAAPTECTTGTCVEVYDSCGTVTPPAWVTVAYYQNLTFAAGTWANSSPIECKCNAYDVTTSLIRECNAYFRTGGNSWSADSSGGYITSLVSADQSGTVSTAYITMTCKGQAP